MVRRWIRAACARIGIRLPFKGAICVQGTQSVSLDSQGHADIKFRKVLVFLETPEAGDLRDAYPIGNGEAISATIFPSPDAVEVFREERPRGRLEVAWLPREPVILNALYEHQHGWRPSKTFDDPAVCVECDCNMPTGVFTIELAAATHFEAAVLFKHPRWPRRLTGRHIVSAALQQLKLPGPAPQISPDGAMVVGEVHAPRVGDRYLLVAFRRCGVADCEEWLKRSSIVRRWQQTVSNWAQALSG
jgi:hypothetical protein